jgi:hypothetical protein
LWSAALLNSMFHSPKIHQEPQPCLFVPIESTVLGKEDLKVNGRGHNDLNQWLAHWDGSAGW